MISIINDPDPVKAYDNEFYVGFKNILKTTIKYLNRKMSCVKG